MESWPDMVRAAVNRTSSELQRAIEAYLEIPRYSWLPRGVGIDLTPIVRSWGEWRAIWPVRYGPVVVAFWFEGTGAFAHTNPILPNTLEGETRWKAILGEEGPVVYGPYGGINGPLWDLAFKTPVWILHFMDRQYRPRWVAWLLDLYEEITERFREAAHRTEGYVETLLLGEREAVQRVLEWTKGKDFPKPREWPALVDEVLDRAQEVWAQALRRRPEAISSSQGKEGKPSPLLAHEYHPRRVAELLSLYGQAIGNLEGRP